MRVDKILLLGLLVGAIVLPARAGAAQDQDAESDFKEYLEELRHAVTGREACETVMDSEPSLPNPAAGYETDPRLIDAYLYVIKKSTDAQCVKGFVWSVEGSVDLVNHKHGKISEKQWKMIGDTLIDVLDNESLCAQNWTLEISAVARTLEKMGPSYRQAAYDWYLRALKKIAEKKVITDDQREFAMQLVWHLLDAGQKIPIKLLREVVQKFDIIRHSQTPAGTGNSSAIAERNQKHVEELERILKAE